MLYTREYVQAAIEDIGADHFDLFLYLCMRSFINHATVRVGEDEVKKIKDGFLLYMTERLDALSAQFFLSSTEAESLVDDDDDDDDDDGGMSEREIKLVEQIEASMIAEEFGCDIEEDMDDFEIER